MKLVIYFSVFNTFSYHWAYNCTPSLSAKNDAIVQERKREIGLSSKCDKLLLYVLKLTINLSGSAHVNTIVLYVPFDAKYFENFVNTFDSLSDTFLWTTSLSNMSRSELHTESYFLSDVTSRIRVCKE